MFTSTNLIKWYVRIYNQFQGAIMWNEGYVADIDYIYGYYHEFNPLRLKFSLISAGIKPPEILNACELGFGQGISLVSHAAGFNINWYGCDFNPNHVGFASEISKGIEPKVEISDQDFVTFCAREDLPNFDFISLHGIWSWISPSNQTVIIDFLKRKLNVGGAVYISYNVPPGWSSMLPMRDLLVAYTKQNVPGGTQMSGKITSAMEFANRLMSVEPAFASANPALAKRLKSMNAQDARYLAHEYFNADWSPMSFMSINAALAEAKLSFAVSSNVLDTVPLINFSEDQLNLLNTIEDPVFRESIKDFMINQTFRRDFWVKGARKLERHEIASAMNGMSFILVSNTEKIELEVQGAKVKANLSSKVYQTVLLALEKAGRCTIGDLKNELKGMVTNTQIDEAVTILVGKGDVLPALPLEEAKNRKKYTSYVNMKLIDLAVSSDAVSYLLSPVTGSGVKVTRIEKLILRAMAQGVKGNDNIAKHVWDTLGAQGQKLKKEGKVLEGDADNLAQLQMLLREFFETRNQMLQRLEISS